jgi:DnaJ-class molecular chaperone
MVDIFNQGHVEKILEKGMPKHDYSGTFGDMYVDFHVKFPEGLSENQMKGLII